MHASVVKTISIIINNRVYTHAKIIIHFVHSKLVHLSDSYYFYNTYTLLCAYKIMHLKTMRASQQLSQGTLWGTIIINSDSLSLVGNLSSSGSSRFSIYGKYIYRESNIVGPEAVSIVGRSKTITVIQQCPFL